MGEDRRLGRGQLRSGVGAKLVGEHPPGPLRGGQRIGLTAAPVERDDQDPPPGLLQRVLRQQPLRLGDHVGVLAQCQPRLQQRRRRHCPDFGQAPALGVGESASGQSPNGSPRHRPSALASRRGLRCVAGGEASAATGGQVGHERRIDLVAPGRERIAGASADDVPPARAARAVGLEGAAQVHDVGVQRPARGGRRIAVPQALDDPVGADDVRRGAARTARSRRSLAPGTVSGAPSSVWTSSGPRTAMRMRGR